MALLTVGFAVIRWRVLPMISAAQQSRQQAIMLAAAADLRSSGDLTAAEEKYQAILQAVSKEH